MCRCPWRPEPPGAGVKAAASCSTRVLGSKLWPSARAASAPNLLLSHLTFPNFTKFLKHTNHNASNWEAVKKITSSRPARLKSGTLISKTTKPTKNKAKGTLIKILVSNKSGECGGHCFPLSGPALGYVDNTAKQEGVNVTYRCVKTSSLMKIGPGELVQQQNTCLT